MKLNPEDLAVSSFETTAPAAPDTDTSRQQTIVIIDPNDPTAATWCYICPVQTERCW